MTPLLIGIFVTTASGLLLAAILFSIKVRFDIRPVVEVSYRPGLEQTGAERPNGLRCEWHGDLVLYNPTPHDAYDVQFLIPTDWPLPVPELVPPHLASKQKSEIPFNVIRVFDRAEVFPHEHEPPRPDFNPPVPQPLRDCVPPELTDFGLVIQYGNGKGLSFYTVFEKSREKQTSEARRMKPKMKAPNKKNAAYG